MPFIYVEADDELIIKFPEPGYMHDWDSTNAESICEKYGHPKFSINFKIDNPNDPIQPMYIFIANSEAYEGELQSEKTSETSYNFKIKGKFKTSVHKDTVVAVKDGATPYLDGVTRFREDYIFEQGEQSSPRNGKWVFSVKKL